MVTLSEDDSFRRGRFVLVGKFNFFSKRIKISRDQNNNWGIPVNTRYDIDDSPKCHRTISYVAYGGWAQELLNPLNRPKNTIFMSNYFLKRI